MKFTEYVLNEEVMAERLLDADGMARVVGKLKSGSVQIAKDIKGKLVKISPVMVSGKSAFVGDEKQMASLKTALTNLSKYEFVPGAAWEKGLNGFSVSAG